MQNDCSEIMLVLHYANVFDKWDTPRTGRSKTTVLFNRIFTKTGHQCV